MATIDIGKIKPVFKGTYDNSTAYVLDDIVYYNGSSYVAKTSTTGNLPTDNTKWNVLASGAGGVYDSTLSIGSAGQQLRVNSGGTALEFATIVGFDGNYKLHHFEKYSSNSTVSVASVNSGSADGERDCIVIGGSNYVTVTPTDNDDLIEMTSGTNYYIPQNNAYGGLGFQSSTATNFSANRNSFFLSGQHSMGSGSGNFDHYQFHWCNYVQTASNIGLSANTTYYIRCIGQKHSTGNTLNYCQPTGNQTDGRHWVTVKHWKKQT